MRRQGEALKYFFLTIKEGNMNKSQNNLMDTKCNCKLSY
jgi:hypothetical protein